MHESLKTSRVTLTSRYFSFHHILICFIYMLVSYSDDNKEQFMTSNEKIGSVITPCNLLKFNINMKYLHISCLYYLCNFWSFSSIGFIWYFIPRIKSNASVVIRGCVLRTLSKNNSTLFYHYQNKTPGYHISQNIVKIQTTWIFMENSIVQKL